MPDLLRPNIVLITSDQHRGDAMGCYGHPCVRTPHLDIIAGEGIRFDQAYTDCPICIPARTTMITGIQSHRYGQPNFASDHRIERVRPDFLGSLMTAAGYQTCLIGKSHWHTPSSFRGGFETWIPFGRLASEKQAAVQELGMHGIGVNELAPTLSPLPAHLNSSNWAVSRAVEFVEEREREQPFFLWLSMIDPHPPNVIHEPYYSMYDKDEIPEPVHPEWANGLRCPVALGKIRCGNSHATMTPTHIRKARGVYYGMISNFDHQLGRLFGTLMREEQWDKTVIVYTSDHGECLFDYGTCFKGSFLEPATRIPMLMRFPKSMGIQGRKSSRALVELADLLPTFCEIAGARMPSDVTGCSLLPHLRAEAREVRQQLHGQIGRQHMFLDGRYKYLYFCDDGADLLFDKEADPLDEHDLSGDRALVKPIRNAFIAHLEAEGHEHVADGELEAGSARVTEEDRTNISGWMGYRGLR